MNEPQVWTLIGVFAAALFGLLTIVVTLFLRIIRAEIGGLEARLGGRMDRIDDRIGSLDGDVQALVKHTFGIDRN